MPIKLIKEERMRNKDFETKLSEKPPSFSTIGFILFSTSLFALLSTFFQAAQADTSPGLIANANLELSHEDNIRRTSDDLNQSDTILAFKPKAKWLALFGKHQLNLSYEGDYAHYSSEGKLNYDDHKFKANGLFDHSYRLNSELEFGIIRDHDDPGSTNATSSTDTAFNKISRDYAQGKLYYGTGKSIGQFIVELKHSKIRYTNNDQSFRDYDQNAITGTFFYRIAPRTRLLLESAFTDYDYQTKNFDQSSDDQRYLLGLEWESTAKTTGIFKIGRQNKEYNSAIYSDISGLTLSLDMIWKPNTYTELKLGATRDTNESAQATTSGFTSENIRAELKHLFTSRTAINASIRLGDEEFSGTTNRNDKREDFRIGLEHELRRWLTISTEIRYESRESNQNQFDYSANIFMIAIGTKFD